MASLKKYREWIETILTERAIQGGDAQVEAQSLFDRERDHYQLIYVGWHGRRFCRKY